MNLFSTFPFSSETIYRVDYTTKNLNRHPTRRLATPDSIGNVSLTKHALDTAVDVEELRQKYANASPAAKKHLNQPLNTEALKEVFEIENNSTYKIHFCNQGQKNETAKNKFLLPDDWMTPETTQKCSFRPPSIWGGDEISLSRPVLPTHNLVPNLRERELLRIKTGNSDYMAKIGNTGTWIMENKLHGDVSIRPQFEQDDLIKIKNLL